MASVYTNIFNLLFKRNSIYVGTIFAGALGYQVGVDIGVDSFWDKMNYGLQWKDIKSRYIEHDDDE